MQVYLFIGVSIAHPSTERSVFDDFSSHDSYSDDSYQEIFPVPLSDYLSDNSDQLTASSSPNNPPDNLPTNHPIDKANLHASPSIESSEHLPIQIPYKNSFVIVHSPSHNQYLNLARVNSGDKEKRFILTELTEPLISKPPISSSERTSLTILHSSNRLSNINLLLSFSQPTSTISTSTLLPALNTTTGGLNLTSLSAVSSLSNGSSNDPSNDPSNNPITAPNAANFSSLTLNAAANSSSPLTNRSNSLTIELVSTNIEKPKELAKSSVKESRATNQPALPDEIDVNRTLLTSEELLDNNSTTSYAALGDDALKLDVNDSTFNKINSTGLDLIADVLNDTITDVDLNSTARTG